MLALSNFFKKKFLPALFILICLNSSTKIQAQSDFISGTATGTGLSSTILNDYQCIGVNPANLGFNPKGSIVYLGLAEISAGLYSEPLNKSDIGRLFRDEALTDAERAATIKRYTEGEIFSHINANLIGLSYHDPKFGGIGLSVKERSFYNLNLNSMAAELLWLGFNSDYFDQKVFDAINNQIIAGVSSEPKPAAELFEGTSFGMFWAREINLSYGNSVFKTPDFELYAGAGFKYFMGYAMAEIHVDGERFYGYSSMSDLFGFDYENKKKSTFGINQNAASGSNSFTPSGNGMGLDFGLSAKIGEKLIVSAAVNDIGSINWNKNVYQASFQANIVRIETGGIGGENFSDIVDAFIVEDDLFEWTQLSNVETKLPSTLRAGGLYRVNELLESGFDIIIPLNNAPGSRNETITAAGVRLQLGSSLALSSGISIGGGTGLNIPFGITLGLGNSWEAGLATHDISSLIKENSPHLSIAMGFLRFRMGSVLSESESANLY